MGRALVAHLRAQGRAVAAPTHAEAPVDDRAALERAVEAAAADTIINLAGISSVTHADARALYETNAFGHLNVLEAAGAAGAPVYLASTANVYGQARSFRESDVPAPVNHYGVSKLMAEQFNRLYSDRLIACAVRPFNCTGRGQKPSLVISKLVDAFRRRAAFVELGDTTVERDYVDIRDVCAMWDAVLAAASPPPVVNFGTGQATRLTDVIALLQEISGHTLDVAHSGGLLRARDIVYQRADTELLESLGFVRRHSLADTLAWMLEDGEKA